jgi:hypothetical protein
VIEHYLLESAEICHAPEACHLISIVFFISLNRYAIILAAGKRTPTGSFPPTTNLISIPAATSALASTF